MLWDIIHDFFVNHIFGGINSDYVIHDGFVGVNPLTEDEYFTGSMVLFNTGDIQLSLGDYLSLIATIITLIAILLFCVFIIKKIIGIIFRLFTGSSAF